MKIFSRLRKLSCFAMIFSAVSSFSWAEEKPTSAALPPAAALSPEQINGFEQYPARTQTLLRLALQLSQQKLGYIYGSADPRQGGMDCSGAIYYLLQQEGLSEVPRSSSEQYVWARKAGTFRAVVGTRLDGFELNELAPGDLLFWTGTYDIKREPPVTHTMIYLGEAKSDRLPLMFGSSDGRTYRGKKQYGVGVFEFRLPQPSEKNPSRFVGYAKIPGFPWGDASWLFVRLIVVDAPGGRARAGIQIGILP